ncbi:MAG TPA: DoxX family protein [Opitutaceae bacterium]|nr:DoxX family protein [Opitutaceae bacterium]
MATEEIVHANRSGAGKPKSLARHLPTAARIVMGLIFAVFGLNMLLNFLPQPSTPMPDRAVALGVALMKTGYLYQLVAGTEVLVGALLLANRFVALALALIAPVIVNIVAFHIFLAPSGLAMALVVLALETYLAWVYRSAFRPMLAARLHP